MDITLLQVDSVIGSRILLQLLLDHKFKAKSLQINIRYTDELTPEDLDVIWNYVKDSEAVGLSFNTFYAHIGGKLALFLKQKGTKYIITGGNHVTALPEEAIEYSDVVVKYEAEITLPEVLNSLGNKEKLSKINGIMYKIDGEVFLNSEPPEIVWDLDTIPFQCTDTDYIKFFNKENLIYTPEKANLNPQFKNCYMIIASRGCPFNCTYCSNSLYHSLNRSFRKIRKRSIQNIISEMEYAMEVGYISFNIVDDNFFAFTLDEIKLFKELYSSRVNKPFTLLGINPNNFRVATSEKKLQLLLECGLTDIMVGIQSGSNKTLKKFKRGYKAEELPKLLEPLDNNRRTIWEPPFDKLNIYLDFICDTIWESDEDKVATIKLALKVLKQYAAYFFTLIYLPGTEIFDEAIKNKWIENNLKDIYLRGIAGVDDNIFNRILFLIAITKERAVTLPEVLVDHIVNVAKVDLELAKEIINSVIYCINGIEQHHDVDLRHAVLMPYLTGFKEWTKTTGDVGRKVLFRSYHESYG